MDIQNLLNSIKKKKPIGAGMSWDGEKVRLVLSQSDGEVVRVKSMEEFPFDGKDPNEFKDHFSTLQLNSRTKFALGLWDKSIKVKKLEVPPLSSKKELKEAITNTFAENLELKPEDYDVRFFPIATEQESEDQLQFRAYGVAQKPVEQMREWSRQIGIKAPVCELSPFSLSAWQMALDPQENYTGAILYRGRTHADFIGVMQGKFNFWESFLTESEDPESSEAPDDVNLQIQQALDSFLLESGLEAIDSLSLAGHWNSTEREQLSATLGVPLVELGVAPSEKVEFLEETMRAKAPKYAMELGLSIFPR